MTSTSGGTGVKTFYKVFFNSATPKATYDKLTTSLTNSINSGLFTNTLKIEATNLNVPNVDNVTSGSFNIHPLETAFPPTLAPSVVPTKTSTHNPSSEPTLEPTTLQPTVEPTLEPTTVEPTLEPTTVEPTLEPTTLQPTFTTVFEKVGTSAEDSVNKMSTNTEVAIAVVIAIVLTILCAAAMFMTYRSYKKINTKEAKDYELENFYFRNNEANNLATLNNSDRDSFEMSNPVHKESRMSLSASTDSSLSVRNIESDPFELSNPAHGETRKSMI